MHRRESYDRTRMSAVSDMTTVRIRSASIARVIRAGPAIADPRIRAMDNCNKVIGDAVILKARLEISDHRRNVPVIERDGIAGRYERAGAASRKAVRWEPCFVCSSTIVRQKARVLRAVRPLYERAAGHCRAGLT